MLLKIGELAKRAGLTVRTLHHYDHIGLLSPSARSESGFRLYNRADVVRLHRIQALKQFGCSLSQIRTFLDEPEGSPIEIITQQMSILEEQMQRARVLRDRLQRLLEQLSRGEETGLVDWLSVLEMMTLYEKHLSKEELDTLLSKRADGNLGEEWRSLARMAQESMDRGIAPESEEARELAWRWMRLLQDTTGNDASLALKLKTIHRQEERARLRSGMTTEMHEYLSQAFASAREAILLKYLTPGELDGMRTRQEAHRLEWPPLVAEARRTMEQGASPDAPEVQSLAARWDGLFKKSHSGGDPELDSKIRSAFRNEPDLTVNIGLDCALLDFMERAVMHRKRSAKEEEAAMARNHAHQSDGSRSVAAPKPTALRVAAFRAAHQLLDRPLILEDPLALKILGAAEEESLRADISQHQTPLLRGLRTAVVVRSRLVEDEWARRKERGVDQCVILGAGLDTFAYRNREGDGCRIFEVDLPSTQQWKREWLRAAGIQEPAFLTFVPVDLEHSTLAETLQRAGFQMDKPTFFSWQGVTMYLEGGAILAILRFIGSLAPGSGVVFDYTVQPSLLSQRERGAMALIAARAARNGEPWKTYFAPAALMGLLQSLGFHQVEDFGPEKLNERYLSGRTDGLRKSGVSRLICAGI